MQAIDLLLSRRSARSLSEPAPDDAALDLILSSAVRAPDHGRLRPWRFVLVRGAARGRFGDLLADYLRRTHPQTPAESLQRERGKALRAPVIVVVAARCQPGVKIPVVEQLLACASAAHAIMLAALALGFNSMWKTGAAAYDPAVKEGLGLEAGDSIVGFMYLGTETEPQGPAVRASWRDLASELPTCD
jgi:nitroreductase